MDKNKFPQMQTIALFIMLMGVEHTKKAETWEFVPSTDIYIVNSDDVDTNGHSSHRKQIWNLQLPQKNDITETLVTVVSGL